MYFKHIDRGAVSAFSPKNKLIACGTSSKGGN